MTASPASNPNPGLPNGKPAASVFTSAEAKLLEAVLQETANGFGGAEPLDPQTKEAFFDVARRYRGRPLDFDPTLVELVRVALRGLLHPDRDGVEFCRQLSVRVAQTLYEDPPARQRLERFWSRLAEGAS